MRVSTMLGLSPPFAVIPSTVFVAPLAILAAIFPSTFAGLAGGFRRWRAFLMAVSINGTLGALYYFFGKSLPDAWWCGVSAFSILLLLVAFGCLAWSTARQRAECDLDPTASLPPSFRELGVLLGFALASMAILALVALAVQWIGTGSPWNIRRDDARKLAFDLPTREFTAGIVGLLAAAAAGLFRRLTDRRLEPLPRASASGETIALGAMLLFGTAIIAFQWPRSAATATIAIDVSEGNAKPSIELRDAELWFEATDLEVAYSGLGVSDDRFFLGGQTSVTFQSGGLIAIDRKTRKHQWSFFERDLRTVFGTPLVVGDRLYCGEGLHTDPACRFFGIDAATGHKRWEHRTTSHAEAMPTHDGSRIWFAAGDDGLYATDSDGRVMFQLNGRQQKLHIDSSALVARGKVYCGSGYQTLTAIALNAADGSEHWRTPLPYRSFAQPVIFGTRLYYGVGTGNLTDDLSREPEPGRTPETVAGGAVVCLDAESGKEIWKAELAKSAHANLAVDGHAVYAASRDGTLYAFDRRNGQPLWKANYGQPLTSGPVLASYTAAKSSVALYLVTPSGTVTAHDPRTGAVLWSRELSLLVDAGIDVFAAPTVIAALDGFERELFVPFTRINKNNGQTRACIARFLDRLAE